MPTTLFSIYIIVVIVEVTTNAVEEDVGGRVERLDGGRAHTDLHQPPELTGEPLSQTVVVEDCHDRPKVDQQWRSLELNVERDSYSN